MSTETSQFGTCELQGDLEAGFYTSKSSRNKRVGRWIIWTGTTSVIVLLACIPLTKISSLIQGLQLHSYSYSVTVSLHRAADNSSISRDIIALQILLSIGK